MPTNGPNPRLLRGPFQEDTIPKPVGLGSYSSREPRSVECTFIEYSMNIQYLFNADRQPISTGRRVLQWTIM
jgi:hypothetical protein